MIDVPSVGQHGHVFRPGPLRVERTYWLSSGVLHWRIGARGGHVAIAEIMSLHIDMPEGKDAIARCELVETSGRTHRISDRHWFGWTAEERHSWGRHQRRTARFQSFVVTLACRIKKANPQAQLLYGPSRGEWIASWLVAGLLALIVVGSAAAMIARKQVSWPALAVMAMALAWLPRLWPLLLSGGLRPIDPVDLHRSVTKQDRTERPPEA